MIIGIDPGTTGAIARYNPDTDRFNGVWDIPNMEREYGKGLQVDAVKLHDLLLKITDEDCSIVIEEVGSMPKQGVVSSFNFGHTVGTIYGIVSALSLPRYRLHPTKWKRKFALIGSGKYAVMDMLKTEYPESAHHLTLRKHHNRSDAMAIAIAGSMNIEVYNETI